MKKYILIISIFIICIFIFLNYSIYKKDKCFYDVLEIEPKLYNIYNYDIYQDIKKLETLQWKDWPEKHLYTETMSWKIIPFYGFGKWIMDYCDFCPNIYSFIKHLPHLKTASLSKLSGGTKLTPHKGYGNLSNNIIRCHFGIDVPDYCYISVKKTDTSPEEIKYQNQNEWLLFDDSKTHYAHNTSNKDRIILLIDIERPKNIKKGISDITDTSELKEIIKYFDK
jgi:hypothetical protein